MFINFLHPLNKQTGFPLTGRLKYFTSTWEKITQDPWVLQVVQGYQIEFMKPPVQLVPARMPSLTPTLETVLDQEVQELLNKEAVHLVKQPVVTDKFAVCCAKKGRRESPCSESKAIKSIHNIRTFQNGRYSYVKRPSKTRGLVGKNRPQGCLFNSTHLDKSSEIPSFSVERQHARVCLSPLRFSFCPESVHEADETSCSSIETAGHSANNLFRRHINYGRILRPSASSGSFSIESPREFRFHSKLREIPFGANSGDRISGLLVNSKTLRLFYRAKN